MRHEIAFAGVFFPSLLLCVLIAAVIWLAIDWLMLRLSVWRLFWHPPLARLCLFFALIGTVSILYPDF